MMLQECWACNFTARVCWAQHLRSINKEIPLHIYVTYSWPSLIRISNYRNLSITRTDSNSPSILETKKNNLLSTNRISLQFEQKPSIFLGIRIRESQLYFIQTSKHISKYFEKPTAEFFEWNIPFEISCRNFLASLVGLLSVLFIFQRVLRLLVYFFKINIGIKTKFP